MLLQDQEQLAQGREIANVTMTNSIVTSYKQGGAPRCTNLFVPGFAVMKTVVSLLNGSRHPGVPLPPELLQRVDSLYAFYHQQWWCYRKMLNHFKCCHALFNGLALLLMAAGMIAGPLLDNSTLVACLAAVGTVVKGWTDFKQYRLKCP